MAISLQQLADDATRYQQAGDHQKAIVAYQKLLTREPNLPDSWYNLALVQRRAKLFQPALESYQRALDLGVAGAEQVHLNRAVILSDDLNRHDQALDELRTSLQLNPDYVPAMLNLGELLEDSGESDEAGALYEKVLSLDPKNALALARLAGISTISDPTHPIIDRMSNLLDDPSIGSANKADVGFALGQVLDSSSQFDKAFEIYATANEASKDSLGPDFEPYDKEEREAYIDKLIEAFPERVDDNLKVVGNSPVFICGMIRTGSTLTERILSAHSQVTAGGEMTILPNLIVDDLQPYPDCLAKKRPYDFQKLRKKYVKEAQLLFPDSQVLSDKRPDNFLNIGLIKRIFPEAKIIHTKRNRIDSCLSIYFAHLDPGMSFALDMKSAAHWCEQFDRLDEHWKTLYPDDIFDFDYDAMVAKPEPQIRELLNFCGLDWEEACLEPHLGTGMIRTGNVSQIREPLYRKSSGRWKNYQGYLDDFLSEFEQKTVSH